MKIVALVGSIRKESYNKKLTLFLQKRYQNKVEIELLPIEKIPMYNQDEDLAPPAVVIEIKKKLQQSDGVLIATPEYNHSIPGVLKNALDWFSRGDKVLVKKPVMIIGATLGVLGTVRAQVHLRQILNSPGMGALTLPGNEVFIGGIQEKMNESGELVDAPTIQFLDVVMNNYMDWVEKTKLL